MIKHKNASNIKILFELLYHTRINLKLRHWATSKYTGSYAQHIALDTIVDDLDESIDELLESYQGKYGILMLNIDNIQTPQNMNDTLDYIQLTTTKIESSKDILLDSWLLNQLDEIITKLYVCIYRITNLK